LAAINASFKATFKTDLDRLRIALMESYNTQITNHVGYIIALSIGFATIFSNKDSLTFFLESNNLIWFCLAASLFVALIAYLSFRIVYWSYLGTAVLSVTEGHVSSINEITTIKGIETYLLKEFQASKISLLVRISKGIYNTDRWKSFPLSPLLIFGYSLGSMLTVLAILKIVGFVA
jgi:hypothetical protein